MGVEIDGIDHGWKHAKVEWHAKATQTGVQGISNLAREKKRREEKTEQGNEPVAVGGGRSLLWEEARGWRRSKACKIPVTQPTWRWRSGRLSSANAPKPRYLAGILRRSAPLPLSWKEEAQGNPEMQEAPSFAAGQEEDDIICSRPAAFPGGVSGTSPEREGTRPGGRDGRARASLTVSINQSHRGRPLLPFTLSHCPAPALQVPASSRISGALLLSFRVLFLWRMAGTR